MKRFFSERSLHLILIAFLIGFFIGISFSIYLSADEPAHRYLDYFHQVYNYVITDYVETIDNKKLFYGAIRGMLRALDDPYSRFLDESDFRSFKEDISGDFFGVGLEITQKNGNTIVIAPIEDSPAMKAGILPGDMITKVNDISVKNKTLDELVNMMRGKPNTTVKIEIKREGIDTPLEFELVRTKIHTKSVSFAIIDTHNIGYLRIKIFGDDTHREVENALKFFTNKNINKLIIDLRGNPGGKLDEAIAIADFFLEKGALIVSTRGKKGTGQNQEARAQHNPIYTGRIVVLVNQGSASASEILAGALKDNKKAVLVGEKTFGKGSVQRLFELSEMVGITLTVARYYTPSGTSIHGVGIQPDITVSGEIISESERKEVNRLLSMKILDEYTKNNRSYNEETKQKFIELLRTKNITISERSAHYLLKKELGRYTRPPVYDLEFDPQLQRAIATLYERS